MGTEARAEHLIAIWRALRDIDVSVEQLESVARESRLSDEMRGAMRRAGATIRRNLGACFESIKGIDSGIEDMV